ncbi:Tubulin-folding cofactor D [Diplonema papillatum]|nr:Tubulin-folding cofactor D [Diplonema papillatum]
MSTEEADDAPLEAATADETPAEDDEDISLPASGSLFKPEHRAEVMEILTRVKEGGEAAHSHGELAYGRVRDILEEYQEQGMLLRSALPEISQLIVDAFWRRALQDKEEVLRRFGGKPVSELLACQAPFEEDDAPRTYLHEVAVLAYTLAKVVGPKKLIAHLPHDVRQFEYAFYFSIWSERVHAARTWEIRYFLMLWMTNTVLVPFDLASIDSGMHDELNLADLLVESAQHSLQLPGKVREVAALFVGRLLTRPDMAGSPQLANFIVWCRRRLSPADADSVVFQQVGALCALAALLKFGKRGELAPHLDAISDILTQDHLAEMNNMLISKMLVKSVQRLGLAYLKPKIVSWRYQRGMRSLLDNLHHAKTGIPKEGTQEGKPAGPVDEGEGEFAPEELEPILDVLSSSLKNPDTIVRWSAAKGIGRITARLDKPEADDVVDAVMACFDLYEDSNGWHGGCLALAELARRGLLLPQVFDRIIPITLQALQYEVDRGSHTVGRPVRDAACYVCWAFARAYAPKDIEDYARKMSASLLAAACYDRDISVRRAAAAAFQECIGRLGNFPRGIDIVTKADYFTLSNRRRAYLEVSPLVASFDPAYHDHFALHLVDNRACHNDRDVRVLAAQTLGVLAQAETGTHRPILSTHVATLLHRVLHSGSGDWRHGAILSVAEIVRVAADKLSDAVRSDVVHLMPRIEAARLYRGRGGESTRVAVCRLIESIALSGIELPEKVEVQTVKGKGFAKTLGRYQQSLDEHLAQVPEEVQAAAAAAFAAFSARYFKEYSDGFHGKIVRRLVPMVGPDRLPNERRGAALALGVVPHFEETHADILGALLGAIPVEADPETRDAETRRNAAAAAAAVVVKAMEARAARGLPVDDGTAVGSVFAVLECATTDYTIDKRGDVGSLVRVAAMEALSSVSLCLLQHDRLTVDYFHRTVAALLRQGTEKLDKVRQVAGALLQKLVGSGIARPALRAADPADEHAAELLDRRIGARAVIDWGAPLETFPVLTPFLAVERWRFAVLYGVVVAAGGMSVHVSRPAFDSLRAWLTDRPDDASRVTEGMARVVTESHGDDRVILPVLGTADKLLSLRLVPPEAALKLAGAVREEVKLSGKDVKILLAAVDVLCGLLSLVDDREESRRLLHALLLLIAGRFPKVRSKVGASLYTTLLVSPHLAPDAGPAQDLLSAGVWDAPSSDSVRAARDKLYPLLGLTKPNLTIKSAASKPDAPKALPDANAYYSTLVRDAGY